MTEQQKKRHIINVQPIRDKETVDEFVWALERYFSQRDALIFRVGVQTGLRVSDIVTLRVKDITDSRTVILYEKKTGKRRAFRIKKKLYVDLMDYTKGMALDDYLFTSKKQPDKHIGTSRVYKIFKEVGELLGLNYIGTHSMRKTFGYFHYNKYKDIVSLMHHFNHSSVPVTLRYIGVTQEHMDQQIEELDICD